MYFAVCKMWRAREWALSESLNAVLLSRAEGGEPGWQTAMARLSDGAARQYGSADVCWRKSRPAGGPEVRDRRAHPGGVTASSGIFGSRNGLAAIMANGV